MAQPAGAISRVRQLQPRHARRPIVNITDLLQQRLQQTPLLNGIHQTRHSDPRVNVRLVRGSQRALPRQGAAAGDSATVTITPRIPSLNYDAFLSRCYPTIRRIGRNAGDYYNRFTYTVSFNVTMRKPADHATRNHTQDEVTTDFILYPSRANGAVRQVTRNSTDWIDEALFNAHIHFEDAFNEWANHNGSGFSLVSINFVEINIVKTRGGGGAYFKVEDTHLSCINVKNDDDLCFKWAILSHFDAERGTVFKGDPTPSQLWAFHGLIPEWFNWEGIQFPIADYDDACDTFEANNPGIALRVWRRERDGAKWIPYCVRRSNVDAAVRKTIDLFLATNTETGDEHYLYIRDLKAFFGVKEMVSLCDTCSIPFKTHEQELAHECDPDGEQLVPEIKYPAHDWPLGFSHHEATERVYDYIAVHVNSEMIDDELQITALEYVPMRGDIEYTLGDEHTVSYSGDKPVQWFMEQMERYSNDRELPVVFRDTKVIHLIVRGLEDEDLQFNRGIRQKINAENMSNITFRHLRFVDTSRFYPSEATSARQLFLQWQEFRAFCYKHYGLEPLWYKTTPALAWDAALRITGAMPEYIQYADTAETRYDFAADAIHGPINLMARRLCRANNPLVEGYDASSSKVYLANFDIKSAYGWSMKQLLPYSDYRMLNEDEVKLFTMDYIQSLPIDGEKGYILEVDLACDPDQKWQDDHAELPLAPDKQSGKLLATFFDKLQYRVHYTLLSYYIGEGMQVKKVHAVMEFTQRPWLKPFMELQEKLRNEATSPMMNKVIKLMTNSVFGKSCYRPRNSHMSFLFNLDTERGRMKFTDYIDDKTDGLQLLSSKLLGITMKLKKITRNQHPAVGATILELGKLQLYRWWYDRLRSAHPDMKLLYCDTDSLIVSMTEDPQVFMKNHPEWFTDEVGNLKEESGGAPGVLFVGAKPKHYLYETSQDKRVRLAGLKRSAAESVDAEVFMDVLDNEAEPVAEVEQTYIDSVTHRITVERIFRRYLDDKDHTRFKLPRYESVPFGHYLAADKAE